jgi:crotonobetainyl-CoA:carnitine CoA-transferase CaiB-like acyl-CoA transferase
MLGGHQAAYSTGIQAFTTAVIALHDRDRTGAGQEVRTSYLESLAYLERKGGVYFQADGTLLGRGQSTGPLVLPASDGYLAFY